MGIPFPHAVDPFVFFPLGTLLGGLIAGYLWNAGTRDSARVGAYAGVVAMLPLVVGLLVWVLDVAFRGLSGDNGSLELLFLIFAGIWLIVGLLGSTISGGVGGVVWAVHSKERNRTAHRTESADPASDTRNEADERAHEPTDTGETREPSGDGTSTQESGQLEGGECPNRTCPVEVDADPETDRSTVDVWKARWFSTFVGGLLGLVLFPDFGILAGVLGVVLLPDVLVVPVTWILLALTIVLAGVTAGFLQESDDREGTIVGAVAGIVTVSPIVLVLLRVDLIAIGTLLFVLLTAVSFGSLGGLVGTYLTRRAGQFVDE